MQKKIRLRHVRAVITLLWMFGPAYCPKATWAAPGDTLQVLTHDKVHMNWYGAFDRRGQFPASNVPLRRVWMHYTMGCPSTGCSAWDYTTKVELLRRTGTFRTIRDSFPNFRVNGQVRDSLPYSITPTTRNRWDATLQQTVIESLDSIVLILYTNSNQPGQPTDTVTVWPAGYVDTIFDATGVPTAFTTVTPSDTYRLQWTYRNRQEEILESIEMARVITPYGGQLPLSWNRTWTFDVTDFAHLLRDSVTIRVFYDGYSDGFSATIRFECIEGTPARPVLALHRLWQGGFPYGVFNDPITKYIFPTKRFIPAGTAGLVVKVLPTGHGFGGSQNCAEFCSKRYYLRVNGWQDDPRTIWRDNCGENDLWPQAGTWLYDRANWCPGDEGTWFIHDVTGRARANDSATFHTVLDNYSWDGAGSRPVYIWTSHVVAYGPWTAASDVAVDEIIAPNNDNRYSRRNPICAHPMVRITNLGRDTLRSTRLQWGVDGVNFDTFNWQGALAPGASAVVTLRSTHPVQTANTVGTFRVTALDANGQTDPTPFDNVRTSSFVNVPNYPHAVRIEVTPNSRPGDTRWQWLDGDGNILLSNLPGLVANQPTQQVFNPAATPGCYTFQLTDFSKNGLNFPFNSDGSGSVFLSNHINGNVVAGFNNNFGTALRHRFTLFGPLAVTARATVSDAQAPTLYPNPSGGELTLSWPGMANNAAAAQVRVLNQLGQAVFRAVWPARQPQLQLRLALPAGPYVVELSYGGALHRLKWMKFES